MKKIIFCLIGMFICILNIKAECLDSEILKWADKTKVMFETSENVTNPEYLYYLYLNPSRDDIDLVVTNDLDNEKLKGAKQENGKFGIASYIHYETKTYTINVYMKKDAKACAGQQVLQLRHKVPPYNDYSKTAYCIENSEAPLCATMADTEDISQEEFIKDMDQYVKDKNKKDNEKNNIIFTIIFDYLIWILIPIIIIYAYYKMKINKVRRIKNEK